MSKPKPGALFIQAWVSEIASVARRPSWIARKMSSHPPQPGAASSPSSIAPAGAVPAATPTSAPPSTREPAGGLPPDLASVRPSRAAPPDEAPAAVIMPQPPPPGGVDIATSIALAQLADENAALRTQITEMAAKMAGLQREVLEASEGQLVQLAVAIAERVIGRELLTDPHLPVVWAREAIESLAAKDGVVIAVAKDVRDNMPDEAWSGVGVDHRVLSDPLLAAGAIEVRTPEGTLAVGPDARLAAVAQALGVAEP